MEGNDLIGKVVLSKAGRDKNHLYILIRQLTPDYVLVANGVTKTINKPKKKKIKHLIIFNDMDVEGGLVTTNRVSINAVAANQVVNAEPYIRYMEDRVFSGLGVPAVLFGRGDTANRSTSDSMSTEMGDRIKAIQKTIEMFVNFNI